MTQSPQEPAPPAPTPASPPKREHRVHEVVFIGYPKLLFIWPLLLAGLVLYPLAGWISPEAPNDSETLGWVYLFITLFVLLTLGVDVDRNQAIFLVVLVGGLWVLGLWLRDSKGFTLFGDIYRWFDALNLRYNREFGFALSLLLLLPYLVMLGLARLNDYWKITHNEFEHYSLGRMDDSLGRGAKTIRTAYPDMFEAILGLAGTLVVFNASGTRELRRIPHVMFLPFVRKRLNQILERTAITMDQVEEEDEEANL